MFFNGKLITKAVIRKEKETKSFDLFRNEKRVKEERYTYVSAEEEEKFTPNELIEHNLHFFDVVSKSYACLGVEIQELIQETLFAALKQAYRDIERGRNRNGIKFISWTKGIVFKVVWDTIYRDKYPFHVPYKSQQKLDKKDIFYLDVSAYSSAENTKIFRGWDSDDKSNTLEEVLNTGIMNAGEEKMNEESLKSSILDLLRTLTPREELVLRFYFGIDINEDFLESIFFSFSSVDFRDKMSSQKKLLAKKYEIGEKEYLGRDVLYNFHSPLKKNDQLPGDFKDFDFTQNEIIAI